MLKSITVLIILLFSTGALAVSESEVLRQEADSLVFVEVVMKLVKDGETPENLKLARDLVSVAERKSTLFQNHHKNSPEFAKYKKRLDTMHAKLSNLKSELDKRTSKDKKGKTSGGKIGELVSYDQWYTLTRTGAKAGKLYRFVGCVIGQFDKTGFYKGPGSCYSKRISYNLSDIQDKAMHGKWVNTHEKKLCITAYVTGNEAYVRKVQPMGACR